jgi:hypothetical protein
LLVHEIPPHLRNTVERLEAPVYIELAGADCLPPPRLALGDTLMVLGLIRNQGRPVRLHLEPGPGRELAESHPLVRELAAPRPGGRLQVDQVPVGRSGRAASWMSATTHRLELPVLPVDQVRANPILAHSLHYGLENTDDRPSVFVDPARPPALAGLLSRQRPTLALFPFNPGRGGHHWQDEEWWLRLARALKPRFALVGVGARDYGGLAAELDQVLCSDDPASTLSELAWLFAHCHGFVGRDGGLYHLAAAVNPRLVVVWDSMASYRFWAGRGGHHVLMSNPYTYRYPQTMRLGLADMVRAAAARGPLTLAGPGGERRVEVPPGAGRAELVELFGGVEAFRRAALAALEEAEDRSGVEAWLGRPELKERFYGQSLDFARAAAAGEAPAGANWVAPVAP